MNSKTLNLIGWVLTALIAFVFFATAILKFTANADTIKQLGMQKTILIYLGILEIISIILFIIPRTGILGTLLITAYLGGAMAACLVKNQDMLAPTLIECVVWITAIIRFPELLSRIKNQNQE